MGVTTPPESRGTTISGAGVGEYFFRSGGSDIQDGRYLSLVFGWTENLLRKISFGYRLRKNRSTAPWSR
jgi:hypothetical protein